ncbi:MAG: DUF2243 domain-containing protein [Salinibacterium sp.]|nr:DUF2243 domain-containing protein [Salinibacterium sp.]MBF0671810.1 DUF2243 domain-containing protein [Salinibacterium sp.]
MSEPRIHTHRSTWGAFLIGVAVMAAVDEIVFHQILGWHHFYDGATLEIGLLTDGLLHAFELFALVAGFFLLAHEWRGGTFNRGFAWAGFLTGAGLFQLWDGIIDHKVLRLHQVRYDVDLLPYDIAWNASGALILLAGVIVGIRAQRRTSAHSTSR